MKKILFSLVALVCSMSMNAQVMKVMKNGVVSATYKGAEYSVVFEEEPVAVKTTVSDFLDASVGEDVYELSGFITNRTDIAGHKFDLTNYGNFDLTDATGHVYVYGIGAKGDIATLGVKEGDIITIKGTRADYKGTPQVAGGQYVSHKSVTATKVADVEALNDDDANNPANYIRLTGKVTNGSAVEGHKFDLTNYGYFDLVDETGSVYVYGVSTGWNGETQKFNTLGVQEGDIITIVAYKTTYKGTTQVIGMYVSHEADKKAENEARYVELATAIEGFQMQWTMVYNSTVNNEENWSAAKAIGKEDMYEEICDQAGMSLSAIQQVLSVKETWIEESYKAGTLVDDADVIFASFETDLQQPLIKVLNDYNQQCSELFAE